MFYKRNEINFDIVNVDKNLNLFDEFCFSLNKVEAGSP